ncbi:MAG: peptidase [Hymenobacter sp.]|jgi:isopenicillin-N N-acyltransferase-like protein|nr:peptidase [Hymenobacter sp.]
MRRIFKWVGYLGLTVLALLLVFCIYIFSVISAKPPVPPDTAVLKTQPQQLAPNCYVLGNNWMRKSESGWWEMYVEGSPFELGVINGKLSKGVFAYQEQAFFDQICKLVPSAFYRGFLKYLIAFYNRDLENNLTEEQRLEIYGVSLSASHKFDVIGPAYQRLMNYHAAHDIGHALQNLALVGCSSFATWGGKSADGQLIIGRNFDFYVGDRFADNKIVAFYKPIQGHEFMMVTWGGMTGVVSGMNMQGLTVTLNAAKSALPGGSATPISLLAREILQYAGTIDEAVVIAKKRHTFVSESLLIGSAQDNKAVIIEKTPEDVQVYDPNLNSIVCTNHYQSEKLGKTELNEHQMEESASVYREQRIEQLMDRAGKLTPQNIACILRDQRGLKDEEIGNGNEKAVNQLIAHHSVIFEPSKRIVWLAAAPWQLGKYVAYDLNKIFAMHGLATNHELVEKEFIPDSPFLHTPAYTDFVAFRKLTAQMQTGQKVDPYEFIRLNPEYYHAYVLAGDVLFRDEKFAKAKEVYSQGLTKVIASQGEEMHIRKQMEKCAEHLN